jgi:hypothetical protein
MQEFPGQLEIRFVSGFDRGRDYPVPPKFLRTEGLVHRLAIVQETHVEGVTDKVFDESLWEAIVDFASQYARGGVLTAAASVRDVGRGETPLAQHLDGWKKAGPGEREPAQLLFVRKRLMLKLCVIAELWCRTGGPKAYHDSYTYVLYSRRDLSTEVPDFLRERPEASRWVLMPAQPPAYEPTLWQRLIDRFRTAR